MDYQDCPSGGKGWHGGKGGGGIWLLNCKTLTTLFTPQVPGGCRKVSKPNCSSEPREVCQPVQVGFHLSNVFILKIKILLLAECLPPGAVHPVWSGPPAVLWDSGERGLSTVPSDWVPAGAERAMFQCSNTAVQVLVFISLKLLYHSDFTAPCPDRCVRTSPSRIVVRR